MPSPFILHHLETESKCMVRVIPGILMPANIGRGFVRRCIGRRRIHKGRIGGSRTGWMRTRRTWSVGRCPCGSWCDFWHVPCIPWRRWSMNWPICFNAIVHYSAEVPCRATRNRSRWPKLIVFLWRPILFLVVVNLNNEFRGLVSQFGANVADRAHLTFPSSGRCCR